MKIRIVTGCSLLMMLGTAVAGTLIYKADAAPQSRAIDVATQEVTPEMIAVWKATAASADYVPPKVPI